MKNFPLKAPALPLIIALAFGTVAIGLYSARSDAADEKKTPAPKPALTVTTAQPQQTRIPIKLAANGNIVAWQEASIGSEANGLRLISVRANVGDVVKTGQVLATFATETVRADVAQAQANLVEAQASASDAAGNAERARTLQTTGALSTQQINQFLTADKTAKARVQAVKAALEVQKQRLKHTQVLAPDNGVISTRNATVGAVVGSGTELFRLIRGGRLEWRAEVTSAELGRLTNGTTALVTAASGAQLQGKVRMVAPTVDPQTRSALVYVDLAPVPGTSTPGMSAAKAGMFARGEFDLGNSSALMVPQAAVVVRDGFSYVFKLGPDQRVSQLKVSTGRRLGDRVEVTQGLDASATLVASGAGFLNEGDTVRVAADSGPVAAQPSTAAAAPKPAPAASK
ncbi:MAG TPA: efflux RND transporter periplasmic adaptor subunit [Burkholderiaceae bacterium]|nr:efflux RND transporter periplasmic adaptor subunit [Burkholderiaceae bacterium]